MARFSYHQASARFAVARRRRDLARALLEAGAKSTTPLGRVLAYAELEMQRANAQARPYIASGASLGRIKGADA